MRIKDLWNSIFNPRVDLEVLLTCRLGGSVVGKGKSPRIFLKRRKLFWLPRFPLALGDSSDRVQLQTAESSLAILRRNGFKNKEIHNYRIFAKTEGPGSRLATVTPV